MKQECVVLGHGVLKFNATGESIRMGMSPAEFAASSLSKLGTLHLGGNASTFTVGPTRVEGVAAHVTLRFEGPRLVRVEIILLDDQTDEGGGTFSLKNELARKARHERWLQEALGVELTPLPLVLEDGEDGKGTARETLPATIGPDHPRHAVCAWGRVVSLLDQRSGGSMIVFSTV